MREKKVSDRLVKAVRGSRTVVIPAALIVLVALATLAFTRGRAALAVRLLALAGVVALGFAVILVLRARAGTCRARSVVSSRTDPVEALRLANRALLTLSGKSPPVVDEKRLIVVLEVPRTSKSFGEQVIASVRRSEEGSTIEVTSDLLVPALTDHGKNRSNVDVVVDALRTLGLPNSGGGDPSLPT